MFKAGEREHLLENLENDYDSLLAVTLMITGLPQSCVLLLLFDKHKKSQGKQSRMHYLLSHQPLNITYQGTATSPFSSDIHTPTYPLSSILTSCQCFLSSFSFLSFSLLPSRSYYGYYLTFRYPLKQPTK